MLEEKVEKREVMYGVTTGIGELAEVVLSPDQTEKFQKFLIYSHAAGCGDPMPEEAVRAAMTTRINVHCNGRSGLRPLITQTLVEMLKLFLDRFGSAVRSRHRVAKLTNYEITWMNENPPLELWVASGSSMGDTLLGWSKTELNGNRCREESCLYAIDMQKYAGWLRDNQCKMA